MTKYSSLAVNTLTNNPKISDLTKIDFLKFSLAQNDENIGQVFFCRFQQFQGLINTLTAEGFSETGRFIRFGNSVFWSQFC